MFAALRLDRHRTEQLLRGCADASSTPVSAAPADSRLETLAKRTGLKVEEVRKQLLHTAILLGIISGAGILSGYFKILLLVPIFALAQYLMLRGHEQRRVMAFEKDYTAMLLSLASSIRTGLDPLVALMGLRNLFAEQSEVRRELEAFVRRIDGGAQEDDAVREFGATIAHPDIPLFTTAFILARKEGSSLSECLQRLARVTRTRQSFRRKVRSAVAMQKLSAIGIGLCTIVIGLIQFSANPAAIQTAWAHPIGQKLLCAGIALVLTGIAWMYRLSSPKG